MENLTGTPEDTALFFAILLVVASIIAIGIFVFTVIAYMFLFAKFERPRWSAWIPIWFEWNMFKCAGMSTAWILIPIIAWSYPFVIGYFYGDYVTQNPVFGLINWIDILVSIAYLTVMWISAARISVKLGFRRALVLVAIFAEPVWAGIIGLGKSQPTDLSTD